MQQCVSLGPAQGWRKVGGRKAVRACRVVPLMQQRQSRCRLSFSAAKGLSPGQPPCQPRHAATLPQCRLCRLCLISMRSRPHFPPPLIDCTTQGRLPVQVSLSSLSADDFYDILTRPPRNMLAQQAALLATEGVELVFTAGAVRAIADAAAAANAALDDIGARRLHTVIEHVLSDVHFTAPEQAATAQLNTAAAPVAAAAPPTVTAGMAAAAAPSSAAEAGETVKVVSCAAAGSRSASTGNASNQHRSGGESGARRSRVAVSDGSGNSSNSSSSGGSGGGAEDGSSSSSGGGGGKESSSSSSSSSSSMASFALVRYEVTAELVNERMRDLLQHEDLSRYLL
jgi:C-terminal, D2-small domain, of ClpB protein